MCQVFQSAGAYAVIAWGITEILDGVISRFGWPDWIATRVVVLFVVGFPVAMWLAWVFDWTPAGIRREAPWTTRNWVSATGAVLFGTWRPEPAASAAQSTILLTIGLLAIAAATERVGIGTGITNAYTRHPGVTASAVATAEPAGQRPALRSLSSA